MAAFQTQRGVRFAVFENHAGHQRMHAALMRADAVGMIFIERKQMAAILQNNSGLRLDDARAEAHEVALNERNQIAFAVRRGDILRVRAAWARSGYSPAALFIRICPRSFSARLAANKSRTSTFMKSRSASWRSRSANASFFASIIRCSASALCAPIALEIEAFENLQHLQRNETLGGRRHLINIVAAIVGGDRLDPIGAMIGKVFERKQSAEFFRAAHELLGDLALVENNPRLPRQSVSRSPPCADC